MKFVFYLLHSLLYEVLLS